VRFKDLQELSGYKQPNKVIDWLREHKVKFVIGGDGKPRTFDDYLREAIDGEPKQKEAAPVLFGR
jgi:hypothetical protein